MPGGKKLVVVLTVLVTGVGTALFFRKDASQVGFWQEASQEDPFRQRIERRLTADSAWTKNLGVQRSAAVARREQALRVAATTAAIPQGLASEGQPTFQKSFNPVGALLEPLEGIPPDEDDAEPADRPAALESQVSGPLSAGLTHKIEDGDTLSKLAVSYLGHADRYLEIYELNRDVLANPDLLPIGKLLRIPPREPRTPGRVETPVPASAEEPRLDLVPVPDAGPSGGPNGGPNGGR